MNDFEKLKETIMRLLTQKKFQKIYRILCIDRYFYWGREFIKISRKKKNRIIHFLRKTGKFQTNFKSVRSFIRNDGKIQPKENFREVMLSVKKYCYKDDYASLYKYLSKKRFFRSRNNFDENNRNKLREYLNNNLVFIFIFENIFDFAVRRGKIHAPNETKKVFVNQNIHNNQHYIDAQKLKDYFYRRDIKKDLGMIRYRRARGVLAWLKRIFLKEILEGKYDKKYYLLMSRGKIFYYKIDVFDSAVGGNFERIRCLFLWLTFL